MKSDPPASSESSFNLLQSQASRRNMSDFYQTDAAFVTLLRSFGDIVAKVGQVLLQKGSMPLGVIVHETGFSGAEVKKALMVMIQQRIVTFQMHARGFVEYVANMDPVFKRLFFPRYILIAKNLYGEVGELLVEDILLHGHRRMSDAVVNASRLLKQRNNVSKPLLEIEKMFQTLVEERFLQQSPEVSCSGGAIPVLKAVNTPFLPVKINYPRMDNPELSSEEPQSKRRKVDQEATGDEGLYFHVNTTRFAYCWLHQMVVQFAGRKFDTATAEVTEVLLRCLNSRGVPGVALHEITDAMPRKKGSAKGTQEQLLSLAAQDPSGFLKKTSDAGGGVYSIDSARFLRTLLQGHAESFVLEHYGAESLRIFRILLLTGQVEQKQLEQRALLPVKDVKLHLYNLLRDGLVNLSELSRTADHAPGRTLFFFGVDLRAVAKMLRSLLCKAMVRVEARLTSERAHSKVMRDKEAHVGSVVASLRQQGADEEQIREEEERLSPTERETLRGSRLREGKLEEAALLLQEDMFVIQTYLQVHLNNSKMEQL